jgi:hypothetical protein
MLKPERAVFLPESPILHPLRITRFGRVPERKNHLCYSAIPMCNGDMVKSVAVHPARITIRHRLIYPSGTITNTTQSHQESQSYIITAPSEEPLFVLLEVALPPWKFQELLG